MDLFQPRVIFKRVSIFISIYHDKYYNSFIYVYFQVLNTSGISHSEHVTTLFMFKVAILSIFTNFVTVSTAYLTKFKT